MSFNSNKNKIILLDFIDYRKSQRPDFSISLFILKKEFIKRGIDSKIISLSAKIKTNAINKDNLYEDLIQELSKSNPSHIGITTMSTNYVNILVAANKIKEAMPEVTIFLGGPQASLTDKETLNKFPSIDFIFRGEVEGAMDELSAYIKGDIGPEKVPNLSYRKDGEVVQNKELKLLNSEELPKIIYNEKFLRKNKNIRLEGGRGCPFKCTFCTTSNYWKKKFRQKPISSLFKEIEENLKKGDLEMIYFSHDLFTLNKDYLLKFCKKLKKIDIDWACYSRIDTLDKEIVNEMIKSGCKRIFFGIESGDQKTQKKMGKNLDLNHADKIISHIANNSDINIITNFVIGFPFDTPQSIYKTIYKHSQYSAKYSAVASISYLEPTKGSQIYEQEKENLIFDDSFLLINYLYNKNNPEKNKEEVRLIKKYPNIFNPYYRIKTEQFTPYFFFSLISLLSTLREILPKTSYQWVKIFEDNPELFFEEVKKMLDWDDKYKPNKKDFKKTIYKDDILLKIMNYFTIKNKALSKEVIKLFKKEIYQNIKN